MAKKIEKKEKNVWKIITIVLIITIIYIVLLQYLKIVEKDKEIEYQKTCIDNCISEFELCLDNVDLLNLEYGITTTPEDPKILSCLWNEDWCVGDCQMHEYKLWKAMGRPE